MFDFLVAQTTGNSDLLKNNKYSDNIKTHHSAGFNTVNRHLPKLISIWQREATKIDTYVVESLTTSLQKQTLAIDYRVPT